MPRGANFYMGMSEIRAAFVGSVLFQGNPSFWASILGVLILFLSPTSRGGDRLLGCGQSCFGLISGRLWAGQAIYMSEL